MGRSSHPELQRGLAFRVYAHLGEVRHRSEVVEYRAAQHLEQVELSRLIVLELRRDGFHVLYEATLPLHSTPSRANPSRACAT